MKLLRTTEVQKLLGISKSSIDRKGKSGDFPSKVILGPHSVAYLEHEIEEWILRQPRGKAVTPHKAIKARKQQRISVDLLKEDEQEGVVI